MLPSAFKTIADLHYYQGILVAELAVTLFVFFIFKIVHYIKWGYDEESGESEQKKDPSAAKEGQESSESRKWDQKAWNVYFPIIFSFHVGAISLIILYIPYVYSAVIGFLHFLCFMVLIVLNTCIKDAEPGNGSRTKGTRIVWGLMCLFNLMLIVGGLSGVEKVYG